MSFRRLDCVEKSDAFGSFEKIGKSRKRFEIWVLRDRLKSFEEKERYHRRGSTFIYLQRCYS